MSIPAIPSITVGLVTLLLTLILLRILPHRAEALYCFFVRLVHPLFLHPRTPSKSKSIRLSKNSNSCSISRGLNMHLCILPCPYIVIAKTLADITLNYDYYFLVVLKQCLFSGRSKLICSSIVCLFWLLQ